MNTRLQQIFGFNEAVSLSDETSLPNGLDVVNTQCKKNSATSRRSSSKAFG